MSFDGLFSDPQRHLAPCAVRRYRAGLKCRNTRRLREAQQAQAAWLAAQGLAPRRIPVGAWAAGGRATALLPMPAAGPR